VPSVTIFFDVVPVRCRSTEVANLEAGVRDQLKGGVQIGGNEQRWRVKGRSERSAGRRQRDTGTMRGCGKDSRREAGVFHSSRSSHRRQDMHSGASLHHVSVKLPARGPQWQQSLFFIGSRARPSKITEKPSLSHYDTI
jgi:hypothetical protein